MPSRPSWHARRDPCDLTDGDLHVWRADFRRRSSTLPALTSTLSPDELEYAGRFRRGRDRRRFLFARGVLRSILARYLGRAPAELSFRYSRAGKPGLERDVVHFNLSHAGDLVVCAVTRAHHVGVDVERVRPGLDALMRWLCGPAERRREFFRGWTRLEALAKARGAVPALDQPSFRALLDGYRGRHWWLRDFVPADGYVAAVASRGAAEPQVTFWQWTSARSR
jgi:4'-phosphopantetheinyl transferase